MGIASGAILPLVYGGLSGLTGVFDDAALLSVYSVLRSAWSQKGTLVSTASLRTAYLPKRTVMLGIFNAVVFGSRTVV